MQYYITHSLYTYAPKNRKWEDVLECIKDYENLIIENDLALDAMKSEFEMYINQVNKAYPKCKELYLSFDEKQVSIYQKTNGCPDNVFFFKISKVKGFYRFSEKSVESSSNVIMY